MAVLWDLTYHNQEVKEVIVEVEEEASVEVSVEIEVEEVEEEALVIEEEEGEEEALVIEEEEEEEEALVIEEEEVEEEDHSVILHQGEAWFHSKERGKCFEHNIRLLFDFILVSY